MIEIAINLLWILIGVIVICAVVYFVFYVLRSVMQIPIPARVEQAVWLIILILVVIALLSLLAGGGGNLHFPKLAVR
jgi:ABC-type transport system involved in cytochrome c biogenesis permease subunit